MKVARTDTGWEEVSNTGGGVVFFFSWERLERALRKKTPELLADDERIDKIEATVLGLKIYVTDK